MALDPEELRQRRMRRHLGMTLRGELGLTEGTGWWIDRRMLAFVSAEPFRPGAILRVRCDFGRELIDMEVRIVQQLDQQWAPRGLRGVPHVARFRLVDKADRRELRDGIRRVNPGVLTEEQREREGSRSSASRSRGSGTRALSFAVRDREDILRARDEEVRDEPSDHAWAVGGDGGGPTSTPSVSTTTSMASRVEERRRKRRAAPEARRGGSRAAAPDPGEELVSAAAAVSRTGELPTVLVALDDLERARRCLRTDGSSIQCAIGDPGGLAVGEEVVLVLQLPNQVYLQPRARVSGAGEEGALVLHAPDAGADAQLLAAILG